MCASQLSSSFSSQSPIDKEINAEDRQLQSQLRLLPHKRLSSGRDVHCGNCNTLVPSLYHAMVFVTYSGGRRKIINTKHYQQKAKLLSKIKTIPWQSLMPHPPHTQGCCRHLQDFEKWHFWLRVCTLDLQ